MTQHTASSASSPSTAPGSPATAEQTQVTLRGAGDLVDALPYLMGFHPDDSIVILALHGDSNRFGGRLRFDIPENHDTWAATAEELAEYLVSASQRRSIKPDGALVFLCRDPRPGEEGRAVMERLRPLAQHLRTACGALDVPVYEALCVSGGRWWSYVSCNAHSPEGVPVDSSGTSVMAAAAAYAGIRVRGGLKELAARFAPLGGAAAEAQERALDSAAADLLGRLLDRDSAKDVQRQTAALVAGALRRFREAPPVDSGQQSAEQAGRVGEQAEPASGVTVLPRDREAQDRGKVEADRREEEADRRDDALLSDAEAARLILGLQDKAARDQAAEWMELPDAAPALRLWRALARRCVGAFQDHAAPPLALAGWVAWSSGDEAEARVAFHRALAAEPGYTFAQLLHEACNGGLDPEPLRDCLRAERLAREGDR